MAPAVQAIRDAVRASPVAGLFGSAEERRVTAAFQAKGSSAGVRG
jgi:hypothetical protein